MPSPTPSPLRRLALGLVAVIVGGLTALAAPLVAQASDILEFTGSATATVNVPGGRSVALTGDTLTVSVDRSGLGWAAPATGWFSPDEAPRVIHSEWYVGDTANADVNDLTVVSTASTYGVSSADAGKFIYYGALIRAWDDYGSREYILWVFSSGTPVWAPPVPTGAIEVTMVDQHIPLEGVEVTAFEMGSSTPAAPPVFSDGAGIALLPDLPVGTYNLLAKKAGYQDNFTGDLWLPMDVEEGQTAQITMGLIPLPTKGTVTVLVEDDDERNLEDAFVLAEPDGGGDPVFETTDADGHATFELAPGDYTFSVSKPGYEDGGGAAAHRTIVAGSNTPSTHLWLAPIRTGAIDVTVQGDNAGPLEGAAVVVKQGGSEIASFTTGPNGTVNFGNLRVGDYTVEVSAEGYIAAVRNPVTVAEAQVTPVAV